MSTYKHGSFKLSHENAHLNVSSIQWLGIRSRDILDRSSNREDNNSNFGVNRVDPTALLKLTARDRKKASRMLENSVVFEENGAEEEWRRELQVMLMLNVKAEMEILA